MNRSMLSLLALLVATPALAQNGAPPPPMFITNVHKCDASKLEALVAHDRPRSGPIMQDLVNEGKISQGGMAVHAWGDEYNLLTWLGAADMDAAVAANEDVNARYDKAYPDDNLFIEVCPQHRDYFWTRRVWTTADTPPPPAGEGNTPILAVSYYTCKFPELAGIVEQYTERGKPIAQALVSEGKLGSEGLYTHAWGDEWNLAITRTARDIPALVAALDTFGERFEAKYGEQSRSLLEEHCTAHKDNIYTMVMSTGAPAS
ncbi:MAG: hypothetical protein ACR2F9_00585 [Longimicrobiaceae bacterium]